MQGFLYIESSLTLNSKVRGTRLSWTCRQLIQLHMASMQRFSDTLELSKYPLARTCRGLSCTVDNYLTPLQGVALFLVDNCANNLFVSVVDFKIVLFCVRFATVVL